MAIIDFSVKDQQKHLSILLGYREGFGMNQNLLLFHDTPANSTAKHGGIQGENFAYIARSRGHLTDVHWKWVHDTFILIF